MELNKDVTFFEKDKTELEMAVIENQKVKIKELLQSRKFNTQQINNAFQIAINNASIDLIDLFKPYFMQDAINIHIRIKIINFQKIIEEKKHKIQSQTGFDSHGGNWPDSATEAMKYKSFVSSEEASEVNKENEEIQRDIECIASYIEKLRGYLMKIPSSGNNVPQFNK